MTVRVPVFVISAVVLVACGAGQEAWPPPAPAGRPVYEAETMVVENRLHGPELCLGVVMLMLPPECGGARIVNWRWSRVDGEERRAGTTWGVYRVQGTYDGAAFTLTDRPQRQPEREPAPEPELRPACPAPGGRPDLATTRDLDAATALARRSPDLAGLWLSPNGGGQVLNGAFTGDVDRHRAELAGTWRGPLCVSQQPRSLRMLRDVQGQLTAGVAGMRVLTTGVDESTNTVLLTVDLAEDDDRRALEDRFGPGTVQVTSALRRIGRA